MSEYNQTYDEAIASVQSGVNIFATYTGIYPQYLEKHGSDIWIAGSAPAAPYTPTAQDKAATNWISGGDQPPK